MQVIHGYPMRYNAGSEVYTQTLCHELARRNEVHVFTRQEDSFAPDYALSSEVDADNEKVKLHVINIPRSKDRYRHVEVDKQFAKILDRIVPDVAHVGHLNHLSTSLIEEAVTRSIPIVYTLHDYWLMCPRGQFMQMHPEKPDEILAVCSGQGNLKCAVRCYARYFAGARNEWEIDAAYWTSWVERRMAHIKEMMEYVNLFIAPSQYLYRRYRDHFGIPERKLAYLGYGFDLKRFSNRHRYSDEPFTFGYIGTHIPAKGIHHLIEAFGKINKSARLRIWGRPTGQDTRALRALGKRLAEGGKDCIEWLPEYRNQAIVTEVFNQVDAIVVPSIWVENSPLVIHEALQARVPVITADVGGMAEYVVHEVNGLLFEHRRPESLARQMQRFVNNPEWARLLGSRGYAQSETGDIPSICDHAVMIEGIYKQVIGRRNSSRIKPLPGPWRITFDTNPEICNLHCIMCEEHSPYSSLPARRKAGFERQTVMPIEMVRRVIAEGVKHGLREVIPSTMGEPLLYKDFDSILEICRESHVKLNLTTNGTFPQHGVMWWSKRIVPVTSDIKISWNGATSRTLESIMLNANWDEMLENVRSLIAERDKYARDCEHYCRITFQTTFLETNVNELPDLIRLAARLGVDRVKGHHLWVHFEKLKDLSMRRSPKAIRRWNRIVDQAYIAAGERTLPNGNKVLLENIFPLDENATEDLAPGGPCPFLGKEAWISAAGRFNPCCAPDNQRRTLGEFGNVKDKGLMEIWNGNAYRHLVNTYRSRKLCLSCNMRKPNTRQDKEKLYE